ncbi:SMC-Scp complex subunit ScpB [Lederbergia galactosidilytica]|uniref:Segregation and condensation protein B n=1 Tax=Lederbergia galactosidilytica TaxID=217031 RepID=A0A178A5N9_9BACI|nr:SMC-Scp complex subunit ScpB [Lederbergia galactosidilytica]KRG12744.1 segregation and condensation protein B [Virgibacillus soli]MBP1914677.1 segregation and condensation protein B [Lederbergia galactosidilytica]OAK75263.1 segregation and condensation protein B [Lederbergia galactosidilytica]
MEEDKQLGILESLLFAAGDEGLSLKQIGEAMGVSEENSFQLLDALKNRYEEDEARGVTIVAFAETYQLVTKKEFSDYLKKLVESPSTSSLSQAGLETLAIIAYKQPITRVEIEVIRGVKTERPIQTLVSKGLIKEVGRAEGTGRAKLYGTTSEFLDYFGLKDLQELPALEEISNDSHAEEDEADLFFSSFKEQIE